jgi:Flp pilus assembly protein TadB
MIPVSGAAILAAASSALVVGLAVYLVAPPPPSLTSRIRPYLRPTLTDLTPSRPSSAMGKILGPIVGNLAEVLGRLVERTGGEVTLLRIRQAGWFRELPEEQMVHAYRLAQLRSVVVATVGGFGVAWVLGLSMPARIALGVLGLVIGITRQHGRLEKAIEERRELMRIEIYTVNQLLAMRVRAGGGVVYAVSATVGRGEGAVIEELSAALRLQRAGWRASDAFRRIAELTPEPYCARTYRLLASAEERGSDLAASLLALSEDVRETRRESIKRSATKRRAAMLVPTIAILAPVLIIFVAAPLPYLITGWQ